MKLRIALRWIAVPISSFAATYIVLFIAANLMPSLGYPYANPVFGSIAAFTFVVSGSFAAPSNTNLAAILLLLVGAIVSWPFLSTLTKPDSITPTYIPMILTYLSGIFGVLLVYFVNKNITINSTRLINTEVAES